MIEKEELARKKFVEGRNCAQAVFATFAPELGIDEATALKIASSFGGGIGRLREVCGAFSGLCMVAGLLRGYADGETPEEKAAHYALIQELAEKFKKEHGSLICREILQLSKDAPTPPTPEARTTKYYSNRPCERCVGTAARLCEELIKENKK